MMEDWNIGLNASVQYSTIRISQALDYRFLVCIISLFQSSLTLTLNSFYSRDGRVKTIRPMNDSALEAVSSESIESESAVGLSGTSP